jgi:3-dehydroquinate synthase
MKQIELVGDTGTCSIMLGASFSELKELCNIEKTVIITDENVHKMYGDKFPPCKVIEIGMGEQRKTLDTAYKIYESFLELELDRSSFILGIGGGIVSDVAGFVASTYLRGLPFAFMPTTLLAQVDASVGGKNGVNFKGYKNLIGTFNQPQFVLCDFAFLNTLFYSELNNGFAEVIKHALIGNSLLFSHMEKNWEKILLLDKDMIEGIVYDSLKVKIDIVSRDEMEKGERRKLNFGHTFGHALEKTTGLKHGEAISIGMLIGAKLSEAKGMLTKRDVERIERLLSNFNLPVRIHGEKEAIIDAIRKDKKREDDDIHFVLLNEIGSARIEKIRIEELKEGMDDLCKHC